MAPDGTLDGGVAALRLVRASLDGEESFVIPVTGATGEIPPEIRGLIDGLVSAVLGALGMCARLDGRAAGDEELAWVSAALDALTEGVSLAALEPSPCSGAPRQP